MEKHNYRVTTQRLRYRQETKKERYPDKETQEAARRNRQLQREKYTLRNTG